MCLTLLNSFNHMKSFTMFIFSWLKFVKKRGTSIYLLRVYVMPFNLRIHCTFSLWHSLQLPIFYEDNRIIGIDSTDKPWWFGNSQRGMTLLRRETPAFAQQKWPGGTLYHYGFCEVAQRQAVFVRKDKPSDRAIKSDKAKVVMTPGCISRILDIPNYIYNSREIGNSANQNLLHTIEVCSIINIKKVLPIDG